MFGKKQEPYFHKVLANIMWMTFDKVFILLLNLLVTVQIANYYGASVYGIYQYAVSLIAIFEILVRFVDARVVKKQYLISSPDEVVYAATICRIFFSAASFVLGMVFLVLYQGQQEFKVIFVILLLNSIVSELRFGMANRFEYLLMSKKIVIAGNAALIVGAFLQLAAVRFEVSITAISVITLISSLINLFILALQYRKEFGSAARCAIDWQMVKGMIRESVPLAIAASGSIIYTRCDSVMLGSLMTTVEVGIYAISVKLINVVQMVNAPIRESVYPKLIRLYQNDKNSYEKEYVKITSVLTWIYIIGVLMSFILLPQAFGFLNKEYIQALTIYKIHVIGSFFSYNAALRAGHLTLVNKGEILTWTQLVSTLINIILNFYLINGYGMYGAALATVITQGMSLLFLNVFFAEGRKVLKWQLKAINPVYIFK